MKHRAAEDEDRRLEQRASELARTGAQQLDDEDRDIGFDIDPRRDDDCVHGMRRAIAPRRRLEFIVRRMSEAEFAGVRRRHLSRARNTWQGWWQEDARNLTLPPDLNHLTQMDLSGTRVDAAR